MPVHRNRILILLAGILILAGCGRGPDDPGKNPTETPVNPVADVHPYFLKVFGDPTDTTFVFRKVRFDQTRDDVMVQEDGLNPTENEKHLLQYEVELGADSASGTDYAEIRYSFDVNGSLDVIMIDFHILDTSRISALSKSIVSTMNTRYGDSYMDSNDFRVWESSFRMGEKDILYEVATRKIDEENDPGITVEYIKY